MCLVHEMSLREEGPSGISLQVTTLSISDNHGLAKNVHGSISFSAGERPSVFSYSL